MQMKFPYELSELRQSLLSKEDLLIYKYEHSDFFDYNQRKYLMNEYKKGIISRQNYYFQQINEDELFNNLDNNEKISISKELTLYESLLLAEQIGVFMEELILDKFYTEDEANEFLNEVLENLYNTSKNILNEEYTHLNEDKGDSYGPDMTYWMEGLGGLFGGILGITIGLIARGKTKKAIQKLEDYMNEIVEKVDDGVNKKKGRGILNWIRTKIVSFFKGKDASGVNSGEQNTICLRVLQENFSAGIATNSMVLCKKLGLLPDDWNNAKNALQNSDYHLGSWQKFVDNIATPINELGNVTEKY